MDLLGKARSQQNVLEGIANRIPGFRGYRDKELRRDADRLEREHLARQLEDCKKALDGIAADATRSGALDGINAVETARKRLDKVVARIRYADRGYAGFFDAVKVDEEALQRVYAFDAALLDEVERIREAARAPEGAVQRMLAGLDALDTRLGEREDVLAGIR
ncbi:MAG TPA: hypothetical protein VFM88_00310 [Vicinamibacteria bacterium]|nr:hypothetical protein [Vicinamibacteria bacterium]